MVGVTQLLSWQASEEHDVAPTVVLWRIVIGWCLNLDRQENLQETSNSLRSPVPLQWSKPLKSKKLIRETLHLSPCQWPLEVIKKKTHVSSSDLIISFDETPSEPLQEPLRSAAPLRWLLKLPHEPLEHLWGSLNTCVCTWHQLCCYIKPPTCWSVHSWSLTELAVASGQLPNGTLPRIWLAHTLNEHLSCFLPTAPQGCAARWCRAGNDACAFSGGYLACYIAYACEICITVSFHRCIRATEQRGGNALIMYLCKNTKRIPPEVFGGKSVFSTHHCDSKMIC